jgi:hypothetical protein
MVATESARCCAASSAAISDAGRSRVRLATRRVAAWTWATRSQSTPTGIVQVALGRRSDVVTGRARLLARRAIVVALVVQLPLCMFRLPALHIPHEGIFHRLVGVVSFNCHGFSPYKIKEIPCAGSRLQNRPWPVPADRLRPRRTSRWIAQGTTRSPRSAAQQRKTRPRSFTCCQYRGDTARCFSKRVPVAAHAPRHARVRFRPASAEARHRVRLLRS